jgi:acyl carrier protein
MTHDEALKWIAELFEESPDSIRPDTPRDAIPTWDSLGVLTLMAALNERFDIVMSTEELGGMQAVSDILAVLGRHGKLATA